MLKITEDTSFATVDASLIIARHFQTNVGILKNILI